MLETDAPFMHPTQRGRKSRCMPHHTVDVCRAVASVLGLPAVEVAAATTSNAHRVFGIAAARARVASAQGQKEEFGIG